MIKKIAILILIISGFINRGFSQDTDRPTSPTLEVVSVDSNGNVLIEWEKSPSPDVAGYIIYIEINELWIAIDTIKNASATSYINSSSDADQISESYVIAAFDSSLNISPLTDCQNTIYCMLDYDSCKTEITINWTNYIGWEDNLSGYNIYVSIDNGSFSLLDSVPDSDTNYIHTNVSENTKYCFYIKAKNKNGRTSTSNKPSYLTTMPNPPDFINADFATISSSNKISLSFSIDINSEINDYILLRSISFNGLFDTIAEFNTTSSTIKYTDNTAIPDMIYYYQLGAVNSCNKIVKYSNIASNIVLKTTNDEFKNTLVWNHYRNWNGNVKQYNIYRIVGNDTTPIYYIYPPDSIYVDDIDTSKYKGVERKFCYYIEAIEDDGNKYGIKGISRSNISCVYLVPKIFIPNIFTPNGDGQNDDFFPDISFTPEKFLFIIVNRWGNKIFETITYGDKWDGKFNNEPAKEGVYIYYIKITTSDNLVIEKSGHVTLLRPGQRN